MDLLYLHISVSRKIYLRTHNWRLHGNGPLVTPGQSSPLTAAERQRASQAAFLLCGGAFTKRPQRLINQIGCNQGQFVAIAQEGGNQCKAKLAQGHE